jgi:hypothetical protein
MRIISYVYDRQRKNKEGYLRVKTKTDVDMYLAYLISAEITFYMLQPMI